MAAFRSQRVTRSSVGSNGLDENFCGRTLRNRSIVHSEDSSLSHLRSRSPKKKQDGIQQQKGTNGGKVTECKQQSVRESWVSPRKRGLSCSEKDNNEKKALDICDTVSPVFKRVKRCSRSETIDGSEDVSPVKNDKQPLERKSLAINNDGDSSQLKRARRFLLLDDCDKREVKKGKDLDNGQNSSVLPIEITAHPTANGINEKDAAVPEFNECESIHLNNKPKYVDVDTCTSVLLTEIENSNSCDHSVLLNGSKIVTISEPDVPCTNSEWEGYSIVSDCLSVSQTSQSQQSTAVLAIENPSQIRESEEEVDVVGDSSCQLKEQCFENANCSIDTAQDIEQITGVTDSSALLDSGLVPLAEPQEHRYALRTSPRRAATVKCSPQKINSPLRDNGQSEDKIPSLNEMEQAVGTVAAGTEHCVEFEEDSQFKRDLPQDSVGECFNGNMSDLPTDLGLGNGHLYTSRESSSQQTREEEEEEPDVYYFESDHVALKHNKDYQRLLQTIAVLEAQRAQAVQDLENLSKHQKEALKDPITFVENLQQKIDMELPCSQRVVQLPQIPWDHYTSGLGNFEKEYRNKKHNTRRLKLIFDKRLPLRPKSPVDSKKDGESSSSSSFYCSMLPSSDAPEVMATNNRTQIIRGRICDDSKSETYNQLWSIEEQKRLEELLLKYPPEEVETRRWQKVADELGSRTAKQVASRVQKYFIKLAQAGIPVPGRTPNLYLSSKKTSNRQQHPLNKHLFRPSTFMTSHQAPVYMDDEDDRSSFYSSQLDASADCEVSDDESIPPAYRLTPEYKELLRLKKMRKHKLDQMQAESGFVQHIGFKCDNCGTDPILGVRWHCQDCPPDGSVDFCDSCSDCLHETESHKGDHQLEPVYRVETFLDRDYCLSQSTGYNYLDPNYYPANR